MDGVATETITVLPPVCLPDAPPHAVAAQLRGALVEPFADFLMRYRWQAVAAVDGLPFPRGTTARLDVAAFLEIRDGKIARIVEHITALAPV